MRIDPVPNGMPDLPLPDSLCTAAELGIGTLKFGWGDWPSAPYLKRDALLDSVVVRNDFLAQLAAPSLSTSALNCSGIPLHPSEHGASIARSPAGQSV